MAYDEQLAVRVRGVIEVRPEVAERKMFGGLAWMVGGNMACGVMGDGLLVRIAPDQTADAFQEPHVRPFGMPGKRPMSGFVLVESQGLADDAELARWVDRGAERAATLPPK